jgi:hypothetical protein
MNNAIDLHQEENKLEHQNLEWKAEMIVHELLIDREAVDLKKDKYQEEASNDLRGHTGLKK